MGEATLALWWLIWDHIANGTNVPDSAIITDDFSVKKRRELTIEGVELRANIRSQDVVRINVIVSTHT